MSRTRIEFISEGFNQIMCTAETVSLISSTCERIASGANAAYNGDGFSSNTITGSRNRYAGRTLGFVSSTDRASAIAEAEDKVLSQAVRE